MNLNIPAIDLEAESQGKWFTYRGAIQLKIARIGNDAYMAGATTMYEMQEEAPEDVPKEEQQSLMSILYARYILMDWKGVINVDTKEPVAYTSEQGAKILNDSQYKDLLVFMLGKARDTEAYWQEETEATAKK